MVVEMEEVMGMMITLVELVEGVLELVEALLGDGTAPTTVSFTEKKENVIFTIT